MIYTFELKSSKRILKSILENKLLMQKHLRRALQLGRVHVAHRTYTSLDCHSAQGRVRCMRTTGDAHED